eukprot:3489423-Rhodomonas_salina.2
MRAPGLAPGFTVHCSVSQTEGIPTLKRLPRLISASHRRLSRTAQRPCTPLLLTLQPPCFASC